MNEIVKRLEIIKSSIAIEDEEIIELQIMKLQKMDIDDGVKKILASLENSEYGDAFAAIEAYLKKYSGVTLYADPEVQGLKLELKTLESKFQKLVEQKTEILNNIEEFNREYTLRIGSLIEDVLALQKKILYKKTIAKAKLKEQYQQDKEIYEEIQSTIGEIKKSIEDLEDVLEKIDEESAEYEEYTKLYDDLKESLHDLEEEQDRQEEQLKEIEDELDNESIEEEYEETKNAYEEYHQEHKEINEQQKDINILDEKEKKELKKLYKKAARLCHPDIVADKYIKQAKEIMQALNAAYSKQNLSEIKMLLLSLENGTGFIVSSDAIDNVKTLKAKIDKIKHKIHEVESEVEAIQKDETFITLSELDDWDSYFDQLKRELQEEKERLEEEVRETLEGKIETQQSFTSESHNFTNNYTADELQPIVYDWIVNKFKRINKVDLSSDYKANIRTEDEAKKVASELIEKGSSSIKLSYLMKLAYGSVDFIVDDVTFDTFDLKVTQTKTQTTQKKKQQPIKAEYSQYSKDIQDIQNPNFEKIRRYCNNLVKNNQADAMQTDLANNGKMYKALVYNALEKFVDKLEGDAISLVDWGCYQGIGSSLVLDYIKEKQLATAVDQIILIDNDTKAISRAIMHIDTFKQNDIDIVPINNMNELEKLENIKNNITLNIVVNDKMPVVCSNINYGLLHNAYFMCVSNKDKSFVDEVYENIDNINDTQNISIEDGKIGRFKKFERIFKINDEIPF